MPAFTSHISDFRPARWVLSFLTLSLGSAQAYLGSFEESDGYRVPGNGNILDAGFGGDARFYLSNNAANGFTGIVPPGTYPNTLGDATHGPDVTRYNAGQFGTSNGGPGGTAVDIPDDSGLWQALAGGRIQEDANAPLYFGGTFNRDYVQAYAYPGARTGSQVLNLLASDVDLSYRYTLDSRDLDGTSPSATNSHRIDVNFWLCPSDFDDPDPGNVLGLSFIDSNGQSLLQIGYTGDNLLQYQLAGDSAWTTTGVSLGTLGWSELSISLDTSANSVSLAARAWSDAGGSLGSLTSLVSGQNLVVDADSLTTLQWDLRGGFLDNGAVAYKNYFDDFNFTVTPVPEPSGALLILSAALTQFVRRRRRPTVSAA